MRKSSRLPTEPILGFASLSKENLATARKPVEEVARNYDALQSMAFECGHVEHLL